MIKRKKSAFLVSILLGIAVFGGLFGFQGNMAQAAPISTQNNSQVPIETRALSDCTTFRIVSVAGDPLSSVVISGGYSGHAFLIVNNDFVSGITVAGLTVPAGGQVTIGTWGTRSNGLGVYLNLEAYQGSGAYPDRVSLSACITSSQLVTLNSQIANNNSWSNTNNCSSFASKVWNAVVTNNTVSAGSINTPSGLVTSIKSKSLYYTNTAFSSTTAVNVKRLQTNGTLITATV
ncbi:MAG: hypothetical protein FWF43_02690 [Propionibacteriaceae bacterium]|nr:hypothetical protein [Propionibacteriaceae bacterium]